MNGFADHSLDEANFSPAGSFTERVRTFDAFPKTKPTYTRRSSTGGYTTVILIVLSTILSFAELRNWWGGHETQQFSVEKGVSHTLQINIDTVVAMKCKDIDINIQDASGDRILAGEIVLKRDPTNWALWVDPKNGLPLHTLGGGSESDRERREGREEEDTHVDHVLGEVKKGARKKFKKGPKVRGSTENACRVYGSLEGNKVQGDFHITARGHGYMEFGGEHLDHSLFNFSHLINELSFGPLYPTLLNPLDQTIATTPITSNRFQYYLSIVPTIYTRSSHPDPNPSTRSRSNTILTNQYAVTTQSREVPVQAPPGIFFKYDIEPILLTISAERGGFLALLVRMVNVVAGVMVGGGWCYSLWELWKENVGGRNRRKSGGEGMLHGREEDEKDE